MIPLDNLVSFESTTGAQTINHYNLFRSIEINGNAAPGYSSGQAISAMERISAEVLPTNMGFEWSGISLEEQESGGQAPFIFAWGLVFVFLVLAAQYENFIDPVIIMKYKVGNKESQNSLLFARSVISECKFVESEKLFKSESIIVMANADKLVAHGQVANITGRLQQIPQAQLAIAAKQKPGSDE